MTESRSAIDSEACTLAELQKFVNDRKINASADSLQRFSAMVKRLRSADELATFRFADLIPEMRNVVYRELLALRIKDGRRFCFPEILGVSKLIYNEASAILYGDNAIDIFIVIKPHSESFLVNGSGFEGSIQGAIAQPLDGWPHHLQLFRRINIKVVVDNSIIARWHSNDSVHHSLLLTNAQLYSLSCFLAQSSNIKHMAIKWYSKNDANLTADDIAECLWPICRLCPRSGITFAGLKQETGAKIRDSMPLTAPPPTPHNFIERFSSYHKEAQIIQRNADTVMLPAARKEDLVQTLGEAHRAAFDVGFITPQRHGRLMESTKALGECVRRTNTRQLQAFVFKKGTKLRAAHDELMEPWQKRCDGDNDEEKEDGGEGEEPCVTLGEMFDSWDSR